MGFMFDTSAVQIESKTQVNVVPPEVKEHYGVTGEQLYQQLLQKVAEYNSIHNTSITVQFDTQDQTIGIHDSQTKLSLKDIQAWNLEIPGTWSLKFRELQQGNFQAIFNPLDRKQGLTQEQFGRWNLIFPLPQEAVRFPPNGVISPSEDIWWKRPQYLDPSGFLEANSNWMRDRIQHDNPQTVVEMQRKITAELYTTENQPLQQFLQSKQRFEHSDRADGR